MMPDFILFPVTYTKHGISINNIKYNNLSIPFKFLFLEDLQNNTTHIL